MKRMIAVDNEITEYHRTCQNEESKEEQQMNGNDEMEWKERIGMEMDRSECD